MTGNRMNTLNDVISTGNTTPPFDTDEYLRSLDDKFALTILPTFIFLGAILIVGFCGNVIVCFIYLKKFKPSTTKCFVLALALFDLLTCCVSIPGELVDMRSNYTSRDVVLCKLFRFCNSFSCVGSGFVLLAVAADRFRKICKPLSSQMAIKTSKIAVGLCCLFSLAVSWPAFILYGSRTVRTEYVSINGSDCSTQDRFIGSLYPLIYNGVQFLVFIGATLVLVLLYGQIWCKISRQVKFRKSSAAFSINTQNRVQIIVGNHTNTSDVSPPTSEEQVSNTRCSPPTSDDVSNKRCLPSTSDDVNNKSCSPPTSDDVSNKRCLPSTSDDVVNDPRYPIGSSLAPETCTRTNVITRDPATDESIIQTNMQICRQTAAQSKKRRQSRVDHQIRRTTRMLFIITLVFVASFLPHLGLMAARAVHQPMFDSLGDVGISAYNLFLRSFFFHCASNPIIYGFNNLQFRLELKALFVKLLCNRKRSVTFST